MFKLLSNPSIATLTSTLLALASVITPATAAPYQFTKVVDTTFNVPGTSTKFFSLGEASISGNSVVFINGSNTGVYLYSNGQLRTITDRTQKAPNPKPGQDVFFRFKRPVISGQNVAFVGISWAGRAEVSPAISGVYGSFNGGPLVAIADWNSPFTTTGYRYWNFGGYNEEKSEIDINGSQVVLANDTENDLIKGENPNYLKQPRRTFLYKDSQLKEVQPIGGSFGFAPTVAGDRILRIEPLRFKNGNPITVIDGGRLTLTTGNEPPKTIVDSNTKLPDNTTIGGLGFSWTQDPTYAYFSSPKFPPALSSNTVFFAATKKPSSQGGLYTYNLKTKSIARIIEQGNQLDDRKTIIVSFGDVAVSDSNLAFRAQAVQAGESPNNSSTEDTLNGIVARNNGKLSLVMRAGDRIDGKVVKRLKPLGKKFLSGNKVVFTVTFTDNTEAIYIAQPIGQTTP